MSKIDFYAIGQGVTIEVSFFDADGVAAAPDPDHAYLLLRDPDGVENKILASAMTASGDGTVFTTDVTATKAGRWHYKGRSTQGLICATPARYFLVAEAEFSDDAP